MFVSTAVAAIEAAVVAAIAAAMATAAVVTVERVNASSASEILKISGATTKV